MSELRGPVLSRSAQVAGLAVGALTLVAGRVAVFRTDNDLGATALVAAGVVIGALAAFGNHLRAVRAAGFGLELGVARQAEQAQAQVERTQSDGDMPRATVLAAAGWVGTRYELLRASQPSGWERTSRQEEALRSARALDTQPLEPQDVAEFFATGSDGNRVAALALIESDPRLATADVLLDGITRSRSAFEQYHALVATEKSLDVLPAADRDRLRAALESALDGRLGAGSSDRRTVARRVLERLSS